MKKLLVAVDGSDVALRAVDYAIREARTVPEVRLHLLNVQEPPQIYGMVTAYLSTEQWHVAHQEIGRRALDPAERAVAAAGLQSSATVVVGPVAQTIVAQADSLGCDAIVMGNRGLTALGDLVLGSVAVKVLHLARCPVTLVK